MTLTLSPFFASVPVSGRHQSRYEPDEDDHGDELDQGLGDHDQRGEVERRVQCEAQGGARRASCASRH